MVACDDAFLVPLAELAWCDDPRRVLAWGRLADEGPSIFGPSHGTAYDIAGQGVADPGSMLLAASLMLEEGLRERGAGATLASAVAYVCGNGAPQPRRRADDARGHRRRPRTASPTRSPTPSSSPRPSRCE